LALRLGTGGPSVRSPQARHGDGIVGFVSELDIVGDARTLDRAIVGAIQGRGPARESLGLAFAVRPASIFEAYEHVMFW